MFYNYHLAASLALIALMTENVLTNVLERIANAAVRVSVFDDLVVARETLVRDKPRRKDDTLRAATIEAIAIKALDPRQSTESIFRKALEFHLEDPRAPEQALPQLFDRIIGDAVRSAIEERLLGKRSPSGLSFP